MKKVGILGGGQLALMMLPTIKKLGFESVVLDQAGNSCEGAADHCIHGDFKNPEDVLKLADCDYVTFEIESVSHAGLKVLSQKTQVHPSPAVLQMGQDKSRQKEFFVQNSIPTSPFEIQTLTGSEVLVDKVVKLCCGGYDGQGVWVSDPDQKIPKNFIGQACVIEKRVDVVKELAQVCCRSKSGEMQFYELVEMVMDPKLNLLDYQVNPAHVDKDLKDEARNYAQKILDKLNYVGTLAVEYFLTTEGELIVNEMAPRVHNSGHNTIESSPTSQFENHILAITEQNLGPSMPSKPALTLNLLGEGSAGATQVHNLVTDPNIFVHLYNKKESRPGRKMGHVTVLGKSETLKEKLNTIKSQIKITGSHS